MKFSHFSLLLAFAENAVNCIPSETITGSLFLFTVNICVKRGQSPIGTVDLALNKKVFLKDSGVAVPIQSLQWQYPGPFKLSFYDGKAEQPYAVVTGPDEATFVSTLCSGFKTNGLGGSSLNVSILDTSRVKPGSPIFDSPESYFIVESSLNSPLEPSSDPLSASSSDPSSASSSDPSSASSSSSSSFASFILALWPSL
jgi:hypothetical protein